MLRSFPQSNLQSTIFQHDTGDFFLKFQLMKNLFIVFFCFLFMNFSWTQEGENFNSWTQGSPAISGKTEYLNSPYVTAGDRVYVVGHQNGSFPEIGWHIEGEMGGVWNHPIKLLDGFSAEIHSGNKAYELNDADEFVNYPYAGQHIFKPENAEIEVQRWQFVPQKKEGLAVQYIISNTSSEEKELLFIFEAASDLRPTWLGDRTGMIDHSDTTYFLEEQQAWIFKDKNNPWFAMVGANKPSVGSQKTNTGFSGKGTSAALEYQLEIPGNGSETITFSIAGSFENENSVKETYLEIQQNLQKEVEKKRRRYEVLANRSKLSIPDKNIEQAFEWLKYNSDWLVQTVPGIGAGITAGIPDYPWWFGVDSEYALQGYMSVGQTDAVYNTIKLLDSVSAQVNGNGRIIHEMSTNGAVFNKGNVNETPQFASLIWEIFKWNGDLKFLEIYFPAIKKGLNWILEKDTDGNLFPEGFGMMEIHGLDSEMIDVASYTQKAFADAAEMAKLMEEQELANQYDETAKKLKQKINEEFWSERFKSYADFIGTDEQALKLIDNAIIRADTLKKPWAVAELKETRQTIVQNPSEGSRPFVVHHNWVVNTPMEVKIADSAKAVKALETAEKYRNPFGVFVTGIDRDEVEQTEEGSFKGGEVFTYTGAVMTLPTAVQIIAENNYGRPDKALEYLERMTRSFSFAFPGSMYEVSPDYGMIVQAWNIYGYAVPVIRQFFGITPNALEKQVLIEPQMPEAWPEASLENVKIAENELSVFYSDNEEIKKIRLVQTRPDWMLELVLNDREFSAYEILEGQAEVHREKGKLIFSGSSKILEVELAVKP